MNTNDSGFTLVELLIAMAVGLIVLGAVYALFTVQSKHLATQEQLAELHQNARVAMEIMVREISMAGYNQTTNPATIPVPRCTNALVAAGTPCVGITNAAANTISFVADRNGNGSTTANEATNPSENIAYDRYPSETSPAGVYSLGRTSNGSKQPVVEYVESLDFKYYIADGEAIPANETANLANIRRVKITIITRTSKEDTSYTDATYGGHYRYYTLSSFAFPRNLALSP